MIMIVDGTNEHEYPNILDEVFKLRARVFSDRLGWDVKVKDGREVDEFDFLSPAHVVSINQEGDVVGAMRLLQTTGPHMLSDVFYQILDGEPPLRSTTVWEATRFCIDLTRLSRKDDTSLVSRTTSEIMIGSFEFAMGAGVTDAVAVIDPVMNRLMKKSGNAPYDYIGSTKQMGKVKAMAALMDCSAERIASLREFSGITHDVFMTREKSRELEASKLKMEEV